MTRSPTTRRMTFSNGLTKHPTVVCAWCYRLLHIGDEGPVSHSICPRCLGDALEDVREDAADVGKAPAGGARGRSAVGHRGPPAESVMANESAEEVA